MLCADLWYFGGEYMHVLKTNVFWHEIFHQLFAHELPGHILAKKYFLCEFSTPVKILLRSCHPYNELYHSLQESKRWNKADIDRATTLVYWSVDVFIHCWLIYFCTCEITNITRGFVFEYFTVLCHQIITMI